MIPLGHSLAWNVFKLTLTDQTLTWGKLHPKPRYFYTENGSQPLLYNSTPPSWYGRVLEHQSAAMTSIAGHKSLIGAWLGSKQCLPNMHNVCGWLYWLYRQILSAATAHMICAVAAEFLIIYLIRDVCWCKLCSRLLYARCMSYNMCNNLSYLRRIIPIKGLAGARACPSLR